MDNTQPQRAGTSAEIMAAMQALTAEQQSLLQEALRLLQENRMSEARKKLEAMLR